MVQQSRQYKVVDDCYVPVGDGVKFKRAGQLVTLTEADAADLDPFVQLVNGTPKAVTRAKREPSKDDDTSAKDTSAKPAHTSDRADAPQ